MTGSQKPLRVKEIVSDYIWSDDGTMENDEVFSIATKQKIAIWRGRELFSLQGEPLKLHQARDLMSASIDDDDDPRR
jgi:hypothetical protein